MGDATQEQQEREIAELVRQTRGEWNEIRIHVCANTHSIGTTARADIRLPRPVARRATDKLSELRETMADPQRGAWLMADIVVPRTGEATFSYDWMSKPDWPGLGGDFDEIHYLDDLAAFPRTPENIPDWYPTADTVTPLPVSQDLGADTPPPPRHGDSPEVALTGLRWPFGVAIDAGGSLYVTDTAHNRVVTLAAETGQPAVLPFALLREPCGVAVDKAGTVYVADSLNDRILALPAGASAATEVPVPGVRYPGGIAVDDDGNLYLADRGNHRVLKLAAGTSTPTVLAFNGLRDPLDVAIDAQGAVYATDGTMHSDNPYSGRLLRLAAGAEEAEQSLTGLQAPCGVAVDSVGDVYISERLDNGRVLKLTHGAGGGLTAAVTGLQQPAGVALDDADTIYVAEMTAGGDDEPGGRVVKLAAAQ